MLDSDGSPQRDDRERRRSCSRSPVSPGCAGETPAEREERRLAEAVVPIGPPAGQPQAASGDTRPSTRGPAAAEETTLAVQAASPAAPPPEGATGAQGAATAAPASRSATQNRGPRRAASAGRGPGAGLGRLTRSRRFRGGERRGCTRSQNHGPLASRTTAPAGHAAAPSTPRARETDPARVQSASPGAAAAAAVGREGAKYRAHANPTHIHTSPPKHFSRKAAFPAGWTRHVRPPAPERSAPGVTLPQLRRQQDARHVIWEGGDSAQAGQDAGPGSADWGAEGDRGSAQGQTQGAGLGGRSKERGRKRGQDTEASGSGGGQSVGSGRHNAGQGPRKGRGHVKGTQGREQGAKAGGHRAHGVERGAVSERGRSQGHGHGHGKDMARAQVTGGRTRSVDRGTKPWGRGRDPRARARAPSALGDRQDGAREPRGEGGAKRGGLGVGCPHSRMCSQCGASPSASNKCRRATPTTTTTTTTPNSTTSTPTQETSSPPNPPNPRTSWPLPAPRAYPAQMAAASAAGGQDAAPAPQAQGPQGGPARGTEGARPWERDWDTVSDPLGGEALSLVVEMYGWLS